MSCTTRGQVGTAGYSDEAVAAASSTKGLVRRGPGDTAEELTLPNRLPAALRDQGGGVAPVRAGGEKCDPGQQRQKNVGFVGQLNRGNQHVKYQRHLFLWHLTSRVNIFLSPQKNRAKKALQYLVGKGVGVGN